MQITGKVSLNKAADKSVGLTKSYCERNTMQFWIKLLTCGIERDRIIGEDRCNLLGRK